MTPLPMHAPRPRPEEPEHPFAGHIEFQGLDIDVETPAGGRRSGTDKSGEPWSVRIPWHYGEIRGTRAVDGDAVDAFVGPNRYATHAWIVQAKLPGSKAFDEPKLLLGFDTRADALACFRGAYTGPGFILGINRWPMPALLEALRRPHLQGGRFGVRALQEVMRKAAHGPRLFLRLRKGEQLGLFGPPTGTKAVPVKGHVRATDHGHTYVAPHVRTVDVHAQVIPDKPPAGGNVEVKTVGDLVRGERLGERGVLPRLFPIGSTLSHGDSVYTVKGFEAVRGTPTGWLLTDFGKQNPAANKFANYTVAAPPARTVPASAPAVPVPVAAATAPAARTETLTWQGHRTGGRQVGDVINLGKREWLVVTRAGPVRMRTATERDEDMGDGYQGQRTTTQLVDLRPASQEEIAAETARRQAVQDAKDAPKKAVAALREKLRGPEWLRQDTAPAGVIWDATPAASNLYGLNLHGDEITKGALADGTEVWHDSWRGGDDWRDSYYIPRA